ncbi:XRE family transcriptional regulator, partial [Dysosmobacter welbionis]
GGAGSAGGAGDRVGAQLSGHTGNDHLQGDLVVLAGVGAVQSQGQVGSRIGHTSDAGQLLSAAGRGLVVILEVLLDEQIADLAILQDVGHDILVGAADVAHRTLGNGAVIVDEEDLRIVGDHIGGLRAVAVAKHDVLIVHLVDAGDGAGVAQFVQAGDHTVVII